MTLVWVLLLALTFGSSLVGIEQGASVTSAAALAILSVALLKVRLIGIHFMELRVAPRPLRMLFELYIVAVLGTLVILALIVHP